MQQKVHDFMVYLEQDGDSGWYVAKVPDIPGCYTQGKTVEQVMERIKEAIQVCVEADMVETSKAKFIGVQKVKVKV